MRLGEPVLIVNRCCSTISRRLSNQPSFGLATILPGPLAPAPMRDDAVSELEACTPAFAAQDCRAQHLVRLAGLARSHRLTTTNPRSRCWSWHRTSPSPLGQR